MLLSWIGGLLTMDALVIFVVWRAAEVELRRLQQPFQSSAAITAFYPGVDNETVVRAKTAARLAGDIPQSIVIFVGGARPQRNYFGAHNMAQVAIASGINAERVRYDTVSNDTISNVESLVAIITPANTRQVVLVADRLHLLRIRWLMHQRGYPAIQLSHEIAEPDWTWTTIAWRSHFEAAAWASMLLPEALRIFWLNSTRT